MYRGFKLKGFDVGMFETVAGRCASDEVLAMGRARSTEFSRSVLNAVACLAAKGDVIDGDMLEAAWFPQGGFDVFISHSHADRNMALSLSGALQRFFGLKAFVDSCVWDCRDRLIEKIRELSGNNPKCPCRDPNKENAVISHADMMLNSSLLRMIDSCECLMFFDTPRSINRYKLADKTLSAWLYSEIMISRFIRVVVPDRRRNKRRLLNESITPAMDSLDLKISHGAELGHLSVLTRDAFSAWTRAAQMLSGRPSLDSLCDLVQGDSLSAGSEK